jgi:hypothetical protein
MDGNGNGDVSTFQWEYDQHLRMLEAGGLPADILSASGEGCSARIAVARRGPHRRHRTTRRPIDRGGVGSHR